MSILRPVTRDDLGAILALTVAQNQTGLVADNARSLAQFALEPNTHPRGIWAEDATVGFRMAIDLAEHPNLDAEDNPDRVYLSRFMVNRAHQGRGHGRRAPVALGDRARGRGRAGLSTSAVPCNAVAIALHAAAGFARAGRIVDGEPELDWRLPE